MKAAIAAVLVSVSLPASVSAFDAAGFIQQKCSSCHNEGVYTRPDRRVQSLQQLDAQVRRCDANLGTALFNEDVSEVVRYLDREYYHFGK